MLSEREKMPRILGFVRVLMYNATFFQRVPVNIQKNRHFFLNRSVLHFDWATIQKDQLSPTLRKLSYKTSFTSDNNLD